MAAGNERHDHMIDTEAHPENRKAAGFFILLLPGIFFWREGRENRGLAEYMGEPSDRLLMWSGYCFFRLDCYPGLTHFDQP